MTTNQTIDGVPRELISDCIAYLQGSHRAEVNICIRLMRDLLERDNDTSLVPGAHEFKGTPLPTKADYQRLDEALNKIGMITPAAQPQGETVTVEAVAVTRDNGAGSLRLEWLLEGGIAQMECAGMVLFAIPEANDLCDEDGSAEVYLTPPQTDQPAPVAVVLPVDPERERLMEIVQQYPNVDPLKYDAAVRALRK